MVFQILVLLITVSIFADTQADITTSCVSQSEASVRLDLAIHFLQQIRNYHYQNPPIDTLSKIHCSQPMDCEDVLRDGAKVSGVYTIWPRNRITRSPISVYCDMDTNGGGWTVFQRRGDFGKPKDFFNQDWDKYKAGFGDVDKDFWLGNDNIFAISNQRDYSLRVDLQDVEGNKGYASYSTFWIDGEDHKYSLHYNNYSGNAGDSLADGYVYTGHKFSTKDQYNHKDDPLEPCDETHKAGWWFRHSCIRYSLNGIYYKGKHSNYTNGVIWGSFQGYDNSLEWTEMKIRSRDFSA